MLKTLSLLGQGTGGNGTGSITVTDGTNSVSGVTTVTFANATVSGSSPNATVNVADLTVTDGTNVINNVTNITINGGKVKGNSANVTIFTNGPNGVPTQVQTATARSGNNTPNFLTVTFGANVTVGNMVAFIVAGYGNPTGNTAAVTAPSGVFLLTQDRGNQVANEQIGYYLKCITTPESAYTFNFTTPNGFMNIFAAEIAGAGYAIGSIGIPQNISGNTLTFPSLQLWGGLTYISMEIDVGPANVSSVSAGLTQLAYLSNNANHSAWIGTANSAVRGTNQSVTFGSTPGSLFLSGTLTLFP